MKILISKTNKRYLSTQINRSAFFQSMLKKQSPNLKLDQFSWEVSKTHLKTQYS